MTREEAIKVIRKMLAYTDLSVRANLTADMVDACHLAIEALEQEPRKGHWIDTGWISECSCCHESAFPFDDSGYGSIYHNFCPNCGAKMD